MWSFTTTPSGTEAPVRLDPRTMESWKTPWFAAPSGPVRRQMAGKERAYDGRALGDVRFQLMGDRPIISAERTHMNGRIIGQTCCRTTPAAMGFWGIAFLLAYGAARVAGSFWPAVGHYGDTVILVSLGVACFANFARNR